MKISVFTTVTNPEERYDPWKESLASVKDWADEVVVVNGGKSLDYPYKVKEVQYHWPNKWSWGELPKHLNAGLQACTGDWAIKFDIDYVFPSVTKTFIKDHLEANNKWMVATFQKHSAILSQLFYQKGEDSLAVNIGKFNNLAYGIDQNKKTDLCKPIIWDGKSYYKGVPEGRLVPRSSIGKTGLDFYNFDYTFKPKEFVEKEFFRFSMAYKRFFGQTSWGETPEQSFNEFIKMMRVRSKNRGTYHIPINDIPVFIRDKVESITPDLYGHSAWGLL